MSRRTWLAIAQTLLGAALLLGWLWIVDLEAVAETLRQAQWAYVGLAAGIGVMSTFVRAMRWRLVLKPIAQVPRLDVWLISLASSLINFVIPIRSGEIARSLFLRQRDKVAISTSLPTVAVDRSFDLLAVLVIGAVGALTGLRLADSLSLVLLLGAGLFTIFAVFVLMVIFWQDRLMSVAERTAPRLIGESLSSRFLRILDRLLKGFTAVGSQPRMLLPLIAMSFGAALLDAAMFFLLFISVGTFISPLVVLTGYALFVITFLVPGAPGYIGSMEAFGSIIFSALGVEQAAAASAVLIFHALNALILGIFGGIAIWALGFRPSSALRLVVEAQSSAGISASQPRPSPEG